MTERDSEFARMQWIEKRNREALQNFLRTHPDGRAIPRKKDRPEQNK